MKTKFAANAHLCLPQSDNMAEKADSKTSLCKDSSFDQSQKHAQSTSLSFVRKLFKSHGEFCASQPWEVIVTTLTFLVCLLTVVAKQSLVSERQRAGCDADCAQDVSQRPSEPAVDDDGTNDGSVSDSDGMENLLMTFMRCLAVLHCYHRFRKIHRVGSGFVMKIAVAYLLVASVLFCLVTTTLSGPFSLRFRLMYDSWFLVLLLIDLPRVARMAQFALSSSHHRRISENISHGMYVLAPTFALETVAKVLLMGMASLTGIPKMQTYSWYATVFNLVNFLVYMTFFPAGLALILELMYCSDGRPTWNVRQVIQSLPNIDTPSPAVHKVRVVGTAALIILHIVFQRPMILDVESLSEQMKDSSVLQFSSVKYAFCLLYYNAEHILVIALMMGLSIKYLFYDDLDEGVELRKTYIEELTRKFEKDSELEEDVARKDDVDLLSNSTDEGISNGSQTGSSNCDKGLAVRPDAISSAKTRGFCLVLDESSSDSNWSELTIPDLKDRDARVTDSISSSDTDEEAPVPSQLHSKKSGPLRSLAECSKILELPNGPENLSDEEVIQLVEAKRIRSHVLEKVLKNNLRGVEVRRKLVERIADLQPSCMKDIPYKGYEYELIMGACAESVIGFMSIPLGVVGPLKLDGNLFTIPMATTEGCLIASTNRGCSALRECGVTSTVTDDGMSRAPVLRFGSSLQAAEVKRWMENPENFRLLKGHFDSTSRFARLQRLHIRIAGRMLYVRFIAKTGDAMGMNMLSKATEFTLNRMLEIFPDMLIISLSGNFCTDKKPAAVNWIDGRGKSVVCEAVVPAAVVETTLKTTTAALVDLNNAKNLTGSAMAGSIGGFNAHAANIVTAVYIATGQDAAQNVGSSNCITLMEPWGADGRDLYITCTMPSIEVGTVGGGTVLLAQAACLEMLQVRGPHPTSPGENARQLARIVCGAVLAGELSLMSALAAGHLVKSHLRHNRSTLQFNNSSSGASTTASSSTLCSSLSSSPLQTQKFSSSDLDKMGKRFPFS